MIPGISPESVIVFSSTDTSMLPSARTRFPSRSNPQMLTSDEARLRDLRHRIAVSSERRHEITGRQHVVEPAGAGTRVIVYINSHLQLYSNAFSGTPVLSNVNVSGTSLRRKVTVKISPSTVVVTLRMSMCPTSSWETSSDTD